MAAGREQILQDGEQNSYYFSHTSFFIIKTLKTFVL